MKEFRQHHRQGEVSEMYRFTFFYFENNEEIFFTYEGDLIKEGLTEDRLKHRMSDSNQIITTKEN